MRLLAPSILVLLLVVTPAHGDPNLYWSSGFASGTNGTVLATAVFDGDLYIGGDFSSVAGVSADHIARWNGTSWSAVGSGTDGPVHAMYVYNGELWIGGDFTDAGPFTTNNIARWTGSSYGTVGAGFDGPVYAISEFGNLVVATGSFSNSGATQCSNIARWFGFTWAPMGNGLSALGRVLYEATDGTLYVGGGFFSAGAKSVASVASWNGTEFFDLDGGLGGGFQNQPFVESIVEFQGDIFVGGRFDFAGSQEISFVARWTGSQWVRLGEGIDASGAVIPTVAGVYAMVPYYNELIVAGAFDIAGGEAMSNVARWNGVTWKDLGWGLDGEAFGATVYDDAFYAVGDFSSAGPFTSNNVAAWERPTPTATPLESTTRISFANPTHGLVQLNYSMSNPTGARLSLHDLRGRRVAVWQPQLQESGTTTIRLPDLAAGVYLLSLQTPTTRIDRKLTLVR